jgi:hypothetical protein
MGLGLLSDGNLIFKRKYRWAFEVQGLVRGDVPSHYVRLAARPNLQIDEAEINYLHGTDWLPGKGKWQTITVTYYDTSSTKMKPLWDWLASVYNFTDAIGLHQASTRQSYAGVGIIRLFDGCGTTMEEWKLFGMWPQAVNFGELDYSSSETADIELTLRYNAVEYNSQCGPAINPACGGCFGTSVGGNNTFNNFPLMPPASLPLGAGLGSGQGMTNPPLAANNLNFLNFGLIPPNSSTLGVSIKKL